MLETTKFILTFTFQDFWHFAGTWILLEAITGGLWRMTYAAARWEGNRQNARNATTNS